MFIFETVLGIRDRSHFVSVACAHMDFHYQPSFVIENLYHGLEQFCYFGVVSLHLFSEGHGRRSLGKTSQVGVDHCTLKKNYYFNSVFGLKLAHRVCKTESLSLFNAGLIWLFQIKRTHAAGIFIRKSLWLNFGKISMNDCSVLL